jgi:hypothetical protein
MGLSSNGCTGHGSADENNRWPGLQDDRRLRHVNTAPAVRGRRTPYPSVCAWESRLRTSDRVSLEFSLDLDATSNRYTTSRRVGAWRRNPGMTISVDAGSLASGRRRKNLSHWRIRADCSARAASAGSTTNLDFCTRRAPTARPAIATTASGSCPASIAYSRSRSLVSCLSRSVPC